MNLLITTLGTSWQIVPELFGLTNPGDYYFFTGNEKVIKFREENKIQCVDELWVVTTESQKDLEILKDWAKKWNCRLHVFVCNGVDSFADEAEILKMRSFIYRIVLFGTEKSDLLYLSLAGGRKTMSVIDKDSVLNRTTDFGISIFDRSKLCPELSAF